MNKHNNKNLIVTGGLNERGCPEQYVVHMILMMHMHMLLVLGAEMMESDVVSAEKRNKWL